MQLLQKGLTSLQLSLDRINQSREDNDEMWYPDLKKRENQNKGENQNPVFYSFFRNYGLSAENFFFENYRNDPDEKITRFRHFRQSLIFWDLVSWRKEKRSWQDNLCSFDRVNFVALKNVSNHLKVRWNDGLWLFLLVRQMSSSLFQTILAKIKWIFTSAFEFAGEKDNLSLSKLKST